MKTQVAAQKPRLGFFDVQDKSKLDKTGKKLITALEKPTYHYKTALDFWVYLYPIEFVSFPVQETV